jgi:probable F420-dependent oxidoreductase
VAELGPARPRTRFGLRLRGTAGIPEQAAEAERLGYDYVCMGEHVFSPGPSANAFVSLAAAAGATSRIGLLSAVALVPLYPPALLAKMAAVLDETSAGRFSLGVGVGGEHEAEFRAIGVPLSERGARTDEALEVITRLLTGEPVHYAGRWTTLTGERFDPRPVRPGGLPVWVAGRSIAAMRRAGRFGSVWLPYLLTPERIADGLRTVRAEADAAGRPGAVTGGCYVFVTCYPDGNKARRLAGETVAGKYPKSDARKVGRYPVAGTPRECADQLREYVAAGAAQLILNLAAPPDDYAAMRELVAREVMPELRT